MKHFLLIVIREARYFNMNLLELMEGCEIPIVQIGSLFKKWLCVETYSESVVNSR